MGVLNTREVSDVDGYDSALKAYLRKEETKI
jgi:hypothetical protein